MQDRSDTALTPLIPAPEVVRARLASLLTEAAVLRRQLKVSERAARETERLERQLAHGGKAVGGDAHTDRQEVRLGS